MANIGNNQPAIGIKELVVLDIARYIEISARWLLLPRSGSCRHPRKGYFLNGFVQ
jgi:hypothetical protein